MKAHLLKRNDPADGLLEKLNKVYPSYPFEKYPEATIIYMLNECLDEVLGKDYTKQRISKRKEKILYDRFLGKIQCKFGPWVNIHNFKIKGYDVFFNTNAAGIYNNEKGRLYAISTPDLYITSHAMSRFEERLDTDFYLDYFEYVLERVRKQFRASATALDILRESIVTSEMEYAQKDNLIYYKIKFGVIVLQRIEDIFVALTFLTFEMMEAQDRLQWKKVIGMDKEVSNLADILCMETVNIQLMDTEGIKERME